jgi:hypothetical protein
VPEPEGVAFRRVRIPVGRAEVLIDWMDRAGGSEPIPFTVWTRGDPAAFGGVTCRVVTEPDIVGWRRAPEPAAPEEPEDPGARAPGDGDQG